MVPVASSLYGQRSFRRVGIPWYPYSHARVIRFQWEIEERAGGRGRIVVPIRYSVGLRPDDRRLGIIERLEKSGSETFTPMPLGCDFQLVGGVPAAMITSGVLI